MSSHAGLVLPGLSALVGLVCVAFGVLFLRKYVDMASSETVDVTDVDPSMGTVQLVGRAKAIGEPLVAPFSETETLAYTWQIKQYKPVGSGTKGNQIGRGKEVTPFVLEDETQYLTTFGTDTAPQPQTTTAGNAEDW